LPRWKRIWTLQEFVVAKELGIRCGSKTISRRDLQGFTMFHESALRFICGDEKDRAPSRDDNLNILAEGKDSDGNTTQDLDGKLKKC
jgi:hypothetical protein